MIRIKTTAGYRVAATWIHLKTETKQIRNTSRTAFLMVNSVDRMASFPFPRMYPLFCLHMWKTLLPQLALPRLLYHAVIKYADSIR